VHYRGAKAANDFAANFFRSFHANGVELVVVVLLLVDGLTLWREFTTGYAIKIDERGEHNREIRPAVDTAGGRRIRAIISIYTKVESIFELPKNRRRARITKLSGRFV